MLHSPKVVRLAVPFGLLLLCTSPTRTAEGLSNFIQQAEDEAGEFHGIHNVIEVAPQIISGSVPEGEEGFAELRERGVRTILSVDGATPEVEIAKRYGMRYVHIPIGYHGIDLPRQMQIARAVRDLPGPVYVHCHHGKHRGPAAAASAAVALNRLSAEQGVAFLQKAGTSESYAGLYDCVRILKAVPARELDRAPADFPEIAPVPGFVKAMSDLQEGYDRLIEIRDAGWQTPWDHPDLVPKAEIGRMENLLRGIQEDPEREKHPADFADMLRASWHATQQLESALNEKQPDDRLSAVLEQINESCKQCHRAYRNKR